MSWSGKAEAEGGAGKQIQNTREGFDSRAPTPVLEGDDGSQTGRKGIECGIAESAKGAVRGERGGQWLHWSVGKKGVSCDVCDVRRRRRGRGRGSFVGVRRTQARPRTCWCWFRSLRFDGGKMDIISTLVELLSFLFARKWHHFARRGGEQLGFIKYGGECEAMEAKHGAKRM